MNKTEFIENELSNLLRAIDKRIAYAEYSKEGGLEFVNIINKENEIMFSVNIISNSNLAIVKDVVKSMKY